MKVLSLRESLKRRRKHMHVGELRQTRRLHYESYSSKGARGRVVDTGPGSDTWPGQRRGRDYSRWLSLSHALLEAFHYLKRK